MLARIWWKEWRNLAPIAATLIVGAGLLQGFLLLYGGPDLKHGVLVPLAMGWAVLYALVAGSASFAEERETRLLGFLDALPVGRGQLWLGKTTFALATSFLLGIVLRLVGLTGWDGTYSTPLLAFPGVDLVFALILAEATVWGLFWSAFAKNAVTAGVLAVLTTTATASIGWGSSLDRTWNGIGVPDRWALVGRLGLLGAALACSWYGLNRELIGMFRPARRVGTGMAQPVARVARTGRMAWSALPTPAFGRLAWQTIREGWSVWAQTLVLTLIVPALGWLFGFSQDEGTVSLVILITVSLLIQGSSVFGLESATGTRSFLDNQAIPHPTLWAAKLTPWLMGLFIYAIIVGGAAVAVALVGDGPRMMGNIATAVSTHGLTVIFSMAWASRDFVEFLAITANAFALGLVAGMMFTKRITAVMIALLGTMVLVPPLAAVALFGMVPAWTLLLPPAILVGVSRVWVGDWVANRGGFRRWLRLASVVAVPFGVLVLGYVMGRAWGVPDIGPQFRGGPTQQLAPNPLYQDYVRLGSDFWVPTRQYPFPAALVEQGWATASADQVAFWKDTTGVRDAVRQLAARPEVLVSIDRPLQTRRQSILNPGQDEVLFRTLGRLAIELTLDGVERRSRGDFAGAWDDILAQYRLSTQAAGGASSLVDYTLAMNLADDALLQALAWAREPAVSLGVIRAARASLQALPVPGMDRLLREESRRLERSLDQPTERWVDEYIQPGQAEDPGTLFARLGSSWAVVPAWERERTRRLLRHVSALAIKFAANDWYERDGYYLPYAPQSGWKNLDPIDPSAVGLFTATEAAARQLHYASTPMADRVTDWIVGAERTYDHELTNRRAFDIYLALRAWQLTHNGKAPESLDELVPSELNTLPADPFSGSGKDNFTYFRGPAVEDPSRPRRDDAADFYLIGVGLDGRRYEHPGGTLPPVISYHPQIQGSDDQIFVLPGQIPLPDPSGKRE